MAAGDVPRSHWRNTAFLGGVEAFWGVGMNVVSAYTILPVFLAERGAGHVAIAVLPAISALGAGLPQAVAPWLTRRSRSLKGWVLGLHLIAPTPMLAIAAGVAWNLCPPVPLVLAGWGIYYALIGLLFPIWLDYMARILDPGLRGRAFGAIFFSQTFTGALGTGAAAWVLEGGTGGGRYALLFVIAWAAPFFGSLLFLGTHEERPAGRPEPPVTLREHFRRLFGLWNQLPWMRPYLAARWLARGSFPLVLSFYAAYAVSRRGVTPATAALYGTVALVAQALSVAGLGALGDRAGHRLPVLLGQASLTAGALLVLLPLPPWSFFVLAALTGIFLGTEFTSQQNWMMDLAAPQTRQSLLALVGFLLTPAAVVLPLAGGFLMDRLGFARVSAGAGAALLLAMALEGRVPARRAEKSARVG